MDPVTIVGLVAGALQCVDLGVKVIKAISEFYTEASSSQAQAKHLCETIRAMIGLVSIYKVTLESIPGSILESDKGLLQDTVAGCIKTIQELSELVSKRCEVNSRLEKLKWPFQEKKTHEYIGRIQEYTSTLVMVLQIGQMYNLSFLADTG